MIAAISLLVPIVLMVALGVFVLFILRSLVISAGIRIRSDMLKLLNSYDRVIEGKSQEIRRLKKEIAELEKKRAMGAELHTESVETAPQPVASGIPAAMSAVPSATNYRVSGFGSSYSAIRDNFRLDEEMKQTLLQRLADEAAAQTDNRGELAGRIRDKLDFDSMFRLAQMGTPEQLQTLRETLEEAETVLLQEYLEQYGENEFDAMRFCDWIDSVAELETNQIKVLSEQDGIYEGFRVVAGKRLYDYSIGEKEIG